MTSGSCGPSRLKKGEREEIVHVCDAASAADCSALDRLSCFVHGDAIDMEITSRFPRGKGDASAIYRKPLAGHWFPEEPSGRQRVTHGYPLILPTEIRDVPNRC